MSYTSDMKKNGREDLHIVNRDRNSSVISVCIPRDARTVYSNIYGDVRMYCCHDLAVSFVFFLPVDVSVTSTTICVQHIRSS